MPEGYRGAVVLKTDRIIPTMDQTNTEKIEDQDKNCETDVKILKEESEFDSITIWGHESVPEETEDTYIKGIQEWISFSNLV